MCIWAQPFLRALLIPLLQSRNYVNAATAASQNLTYASDDTFILRADFTTVLDATGAGRNSVRLQSNKQYGSNTVMVQVFNPVS